MSVPGSEYGNATDLDESLNMRIREWGRQDDSRDVVGGRRRVVGVELDSIPLCSTCCVETAGESRDQVLERGLESVTMFDGGLSRDRLDMLSEESDGEVTLAPRVLSKDRRKLRGATGIEHDLKRYINSPSGRYVSTKLLKRKRSANVRQTNDALNAEDLSSLLDNAADMGISDGCTDNRHSSRAMNASEEPQQEKKRPDAYVSVFDPVGEPAFKPSKTKPLPRWMHLLPNNVYRKREEKANSAVEDGSLESPRLDSPREGKDPSSGGSSEDFQGRPIALVEIPSLRGGGKPTESLTLPMSITDKSRQTSKHNAFSFDPIFVAEHANGNDGYICYRRAQTTGSVYMTPPEYPSCNPPPPRRRTPYPQIFACLPSSRREASSYSPQIKSFSIAEMPFDGPCCELGAPLQSPTALQEDSLSPEGPRDQPVPKGSSAFPSYSSEYVDKHHPRRYSTKEQSYKASEAEAILDKIKRRKSERNNMAEATDELTKKIRGNKSKRLRLGSEEYGIDPRREDLQKELRNLFCEE
jgi:hypothetical protein